MNWMICLTNKGYEASLEARKIYNVVADEKAQAVGMVRIVDESGDSYLYPNEMFASIAIQQTLEKQLLAA
jgi:hypothetical protein